MVFNAGFTGINQIIHYPQIFNALSPIYGIELLLKHPHGFWLLGAIFLVTTGAEALYSDLGHCGKNNIRITWMFVKITLMLNYLGQGAWVLLQHKAALGNINLFFALVPSWFLVPSVLIATVASIIASQALISGSFTLISEAISLNFWPRVKLKYPTNVRGQIYIPSINWILFTGCVLVVLYFRTSEAMTAAYGFSITIAMLMTTFLMFYFLRYVKKIPFWIVGAILTVFVCVEACFFVANAVKIVKRLFFLVFEVGLIGTMYVWFKARKITNRFVKFVNLNDYLAQLVDLSNDTTVPKYASHVVYLTKANNPNQIEKRIVHSIFGGNSKRADVYWLVHIDRADDPYTMEYDVEELVNDKVIRLDFRLGFRIQPRIGLMLKKVVEEMLENKEIQLASRYPSGNLEDIHHFRFVIIESFLSYDNELLGADGFILNAYFSIKRLALSDQRAYGLNTNQARVEMVPLVVTPATNIKLKRAFHKVHGENK